jgi:hypothetical protein
VTPPSVAYGSETTVSVFGTVTGVTGDGGPRGTVTIQTTTDTSLCSPTYLFPLSTTDTFSYYCAITATKLPASTTAYTITATFTPASGTSSSTPSVIYTGSISTESLTITKVLESTTTTLTVSTTFVTYGAETLATFSGRVSGKPTDGDPRGTVTVKTSATVVLCTETLPDSVGTSVPFSCTTTARKLGSAIYTVTASYTPTNSDSSTNTSVTYTASKSTGVTLIVTKAVEPTTTSLTVRPTSVGFGTETSVTLSGTVKGQTTYGVPEGTVIVTMTGVTLCGSVPVTHRSGTTSTFSCRISTGSALAPGSYNVVAHFAPVGSTNPNVTYELSTSLGKSLTVETAI